MNVSKWVALLLLLLASCSDDDGVLPANTGGQGPASATGGSTSTPTTSGSVGGAAGGGGTGSGGESGSVGMAGSGGGGSAGADGSDSGSADASADAGRICDRGGGTDWGKAVVDSTMKRFSDPSSMGGWGYQPALFLHGAYLVYRRTHDARYLSYIKRWIDAHVDANGGIDDTLSWLDDIMPGNVVLDVYQETKDDKYKAAADRLRKRFDTFPRTSDGGFWHNTGYAGQTWGDGVFMSCPFLARYGQIFGDAAYTNDETSKQLVVYHDHLKHPTNGTHYHAWDEQGDASWTTPAILHSAESWCRAVGWYGMGAIEVLEVLPANHPSRAPIVTILQGLVEGFKKNQDPATGRWFQVIDKGSDPGNWLETSCSAMLSYTIARAIQRGYVAATYADVAAKAYQGIMQKVSLGSDGLTNITDISIGTSVGNLAYYFGRPRATNDFHGLGAFLIMLEQFAASCP